MAQHKLYTTAVWTLIACLIAIGLATAFIASLHELRPEIIVETCSFMVALLLVVVERRSTAAERRRVAIGRIVEELRDCAEALCGDVWTQSSENLLEATEDRRDGLRTFYLHLPLSAVTAGLLGEALGGRRDAPMTEDLQRWRAEAEQCNARLTMAELLLFFLPATSDGMDERLRLHVSIAAGPVSDRRRELGDLVQTMSDMASQGLLQDEVNSDLTGAKEALAGAEQIEAITRKLQNHLRFASA